MKQFTEQKGNITFVCSSIFRLFINFIGFLGIISIAYEILAIFSDSRWPLLDKIALYVSIIATLLGTIATALSVYFYSNGTTSPPERLSVYFTAPAIILSCIVALIFFIKYGTIPVNIINGFALLAIAGALLRIQSNPAKDKKLFWNKKK